MFLNIPSEKYFNSGPGDYYGDPYFERGSPGDWLDWESKNPPPARPGSVRIDDRPYSGRGPWGGVDVPRIAPPPPAYVPYFPYQPPVPIKAPVRAWQGPDRIPAGVTQWFDDHIPPPVTYNPAWDHIPGGGPRDPNARPDPRGFSYSGGNRPGDEYGESVIPSTPWDDFGSWVSGLLPGTTGTKGGVGPPPPPNIAGLLPAPP